MIKLYAFISLFFLSFSSISQVPKIPLFEHFTNASCPPCATQNPGMDALLDAQTSEYTRISYQGDFPGADIMNAEYPSGPLVRRQDYNISGFPTLVANALDIGGPASLSQGYFDNLLTLTTPLSITVTQTWNSTSSITVNIDINNVTSTDYNIAAAKLRVAMVESLIHLENPNAGTNGEIDFHAVLRDFITPISGVSIGVVPANSTINFNYTIPDVPNYIRDKNKIKFVAFIQLNNVGEIVQSGQSVQGGAIGIDASASSSSITPSDYCDYSFTPSIDILNNDLTPITDALVEYSINGGIATSEVYSGSIASGLSGNITFPTIQLIPGVSTVSYNVITINGSSGFLSPAALVLADEEYIKLSPSSVGTTINENFEAYGTNTPAPAGVISDNPNDVSAFIINGSAAGLTNLGGHGLSNTCFWWDYWTIQSSISSRLIWDKHDFSIGINQKISFDRAHARYGNSNDKLIVKASIDCGNTWTTVYDKQGAQLATAPVENNVRFFPTAGEWATDTVDLSAFDGMEEVLIAFEGISGYGNDLFIDNINLFSVIPAPSIENTLSSINQSNFCEDSVLVNVDFTNNGNVTLTSLIVSSVINSGSPELIPIALNSPLAIGSTTTVSYWVTNPNNGLLNTIETEFIELNGYDNSVNTQSSYVDLLSINSFYSNTNIGEFNIQFDDFTDQTTWTLTDQTLGIEVISNVGQTFMPNTLYTDNFTLFENHCYSFELFDQNGLCCSQGSGYYDLSIDGISLSSGSFFQGMQQNKFKFSLNPDASIDELNDNSFVIFPNPANNLLNIKSTLSVENASVSLLNNLGQTVKSEEDLNFSNNNQITLRLNDVAPGTYWIRIVSNDNVWSKKVVITK